MAQVLTVGNWPSCAEGHANALGNQVPQPTAGDVVGAADWARSGCRPKARPGGGGK